MVFGKKVAIFYLEWGRNSAPSLEKGRKCPTASSGYTFVCQTILAGN